MHIMYKLIFWRGEVGNIEKPCNFLKTVLYLMQSKKAYAPIRERSRPNVTRKSEVQPLKANSPTVCRLSGRASERTASHPTNA